MTATIRLAVDLQALQTDGIADRGIGRYVAALSAALNRIDRLAAGLLAPELPPPLGLPPELAMGGLVHWDAVSTMRAWSPRAHRSRTTSPRRSSTAGPSTRRGS